MGGYILFEYKINLILKHQNVFVSLKHGKTTPHTGQGDICAWTDKGTHLPAAVKQKKWHSLAAHIN